MLFFSKGFLKIFVLEEATRLHEAIEAACQSIVAASDELNKLDSACGDGDCGSTLKSGAKGKKPLCRISQIIILASSTEYEHNKENNFKFSPY